MKINNFKPLSPSLALLVLLLICSIPKILSAGDYFGALEYYYFGRRPSARAEAMGRSSVASETDGFSCQYNPALIQLNEGLCLSGSYASPYGLLEDATFTFIGLTYTTDDYGSFGLSRYRFDWGSEDIITDENGNILGTFDPNEYFYTLTYAHKFLSEYSFGINLSYYYFKLPSQYQVGVSNSSDELTALPIDIGLLRRIPFNRDENIVHQMTLGASLNNIFGTETGPSDGSDALPQVFHLGVSYKLQLGQLTPQEIRPYQLFAQIEYQDVFNSDYYTGFKLGAEIALYEMLCLRFGYYTEKHEDHRDDFTYGFGLIIPINMLFGLKIIDNIKFDMLVLDQDIDTNLFGQFGEIKDYSNYNLTINFNL